MAVRTNESTKSYCTTNITQDIYWEGKTQEGGSLFLGKKQQRIWQKTGIYIEFLEEKIVEFS